MNLVLTLIGSLLVVTGYAHARETAPTSFVCPVTQEKAVSPEVMMEVSEVMNKRFEAAIGPDFKKISDGKVFLRVAKKPVDKKLMASLVEVAGCGALIDKPACSDFYDPEMGDPLAIFMRMKKTDPLRKQFETALNDLPSRKQKEAAKFCVKLVGGK